MRSLFFATLIGTVSAFALAPSASAGDNGDAFVFGLKLDGDHFFVSVNDTARYRPQLKQAHHKRHEWRHDARRRADDERRRWGRWQRLQRRADQARRHGDYPRADRLFSRARSVARMHHYGRHHDQYGRGCRH